MSTLQLVLEIKSDLPSWLISADLEILAKVQVQYKTLPGWKGDISQVTSFDDLPPTCREYVEFIEQFLNVHIKWIGVGPGREAMIER